MKKFGFVLLLYLILFAFACSSKISGPNVGILKTGPEYPPWFGPVEVYFEKPDVTYEKLGIVSAQASTDQQLTDLVANLRKKAASFGANGIIVHPATTSTGNLMYGQTSFMNSKLHLMATAIRKESDWLPTKKP